MIEINSRISIFNPGCPPLPFWCVKFWRTQTLQSTNWVVSLSLSFPSPSTPPHLKPFIGFTTHCCTTQPRNPPASPVQRSHGGQCVAASDLCHRLVRCCPRQRPLLRLWHEDCHNQLRSGSDEYVVEGRLCVCGCVSVSVWLVQ